MNEFLRGLGQDLRTTLVGADPAPPLKPPRPIVSALGVLVIVLVGGLAVQEMEFPLAAAVGALTVLSLLFVRYKPLWAWRLATVAMLIGLLDPGVPVDDWPWNPVQIFATLVVLFVVALREPLGVIVWSGLISVVIVWAVIPRQEAIGIIILIAAVMVFGEQIQRRRRAQREARELSERSEMLTERARIARELHDVVAHSLSLVAVRAETAPYRLAEVPDAAREEFVALAATARDSLNELRRLLGVLRTEHDLERSPQPTLSDMDDLIGTMRSAGMKISFSGTRSAHSTATGLTVYRIVQEALSNAARHAPGAPVQVTVSSSAGALHVDVRNDPSFHRPPPGSGAGHGLTGMRERVTLLGGNLHYGQTGDGGFEVSAVIPVD